MSEEKAFKISLIKINPDGTEEPNWRSGETWKEIKEKIAQISNAVSFSQHYDLLCRVINIEGIIQEELLPFYKDFILEWLKEHPKAETKELHNQFYTGNILRQSLMLQAKDQLATEGKIESFSQGRGKNRIWQVKEASA